MTLHIRIYDEYKSDSCFDFFQSGDTAEEILDRVCTLAADLKWVYLTSLRGNPVYRFSRGDLFIGIAEPVVDTPVSRISQAIFDIYEQAGLC